MKEIDILTMVYDIVYDDLCFYFKLMFYKIEVNNVFLNDCILRR